MARYTDDSKEQVRDAVDMVDLIGTRTELRRAGADRYTGLCPFHDERTPSFGVTPSKKFYYCFGCQAAGDPFTFVREMEGVDFVGALEFLADRYNVKLELEAEDPQAAARRLRRERLLDLLERTCAYYERYLWDSREAERGREHLLGRGLDEAMLREFRVGYAPSAWDRVLVASRQGGFSEAELYDAGLAQRSREDPRRVYDRFRARIMFPLCDNRGRVLGFGARTMSADQPAAKYINTADNEIYHKGRHLYGIQLARTAATKAGSAIVCEGYTDVIAMHQAGLRNVVGLMGTALTEDQLGELRRLAPSVTLALDADKAGQAAMVRAAGMAARHNLELRVIELPAGSDPAELLQRGGPGALAGLVDRSVAYVRFRVERVLASGDIGTAEGQDRMLAELAVVLGDVGPGALRLELERLVAARLELPEKVVAGLLAPGRARSSQGRAAIPAGFALDARDRSERAFLALCIALPKEGRAALSELDVENVFTVDLNRRAALHLREHIDAPGGDVDEDELGRLLAELTVRASASPALPAQLEVERLQLELALIDREITVARAAGRPGQSELAARRREVQAAVVRALTLALEQTAAPPR
jgi:DNA primase